MTASATDAAPATDDARAEADGPPAPVNLVGRSIVAAATAAVLVVVALEGGGYDIVPRQAAAVVIWWAVVLVAIIRGRRLDVPSVATISATVALLGLGLWAGLTIGGSSSQERSAIEVARWVAYAGPLVLVGWVLPRHLWQGVVLGAVGGATVISLLALAERLSPGLLSASRTVVFENQAQRLVEPLGYWNALGSWGAMNVLLLLGLGSHVRSAILRAVALLPVPAIATMVYVTYSRSSILVTLIGLVVLVTLARNRWTAVLHVLAAGVAVAIAVSVTAAQAPIAKATGTGGAQSLVIAVALCGAGLAGLGITSARLGTDRIRLPYRVARAATIAATVVGVAVGGAAALALGPNAWEKFSSVERDDGSDPNSRLTMVNNGNRVAQWRVALDSWKSDRLTGSGAGTFELTYNERAKDNQFVRDAHSAPLEMLSEQGVVGLTLLVAFMVAALSGGVLAVRRVVTDMDRGLVAGSTAAVAAFLAGTCFDWFWEVGALALLALTLVAALGAAAAPRTPRRPRGPRGLSFGVTAIALVALLVQLPGLVGTSEIRRSQRAVSAGDLREARARADSAIDLQPWASSPFLQRALVDERDAQWSSSIVALELAIERDPKDWRLPLVLARVEAKAGHPDEALAAYREAKRLRPYGRFFQ